jgi:hypothetical protein
VAASRSMARTRSAPDTWCRCTLVISGACSGGCLGPLSSGSGARHGMRSHSSRCRPQSGQAAVSESVNSNSRRSAQPPHIARPAAPRVLARASIALHITHALPGDLRRARGCTLPLLCGATARAFIGRLYARGVPGWTAPSRFRYPGATPRRRRRCHPLVPPTPRERACRV